MENSETIKCTLCGKEIKKDRKFCSSECASKYVSEKAYEEFLLYPEKYNRGNYVPRYGIRRHILEEQNGKCMICGCDQVYNNKPLVFVMDHIDGDASNNCRSNLRLICPNCDSQLPTFKSKNKNSKRRNYWKEHIIIETIKNNKKSMET